MSAMTAFTAYRNSASSDAQGKGLGSPLADVAAECAYKSIDERIKAEFDYGTGHHRYEGAAGSVKKAFEDDIVTANERYWKELQEVITTYQSRPWSVAARARQGSLYDSCRTGLHNARPPWLRLYTDREEELLKLAEASARDDLQETAQALRQRRLEQWRLVREQLLNGADKAMVKFYIEAVLWAQAWNVRNAMVDLAMQRLALFTEILGDAMLREFSQGIIDPKTKRAFEYKEGLFLSMWPAPPLIPYGLIKEPLVIPLQPAASASLIDLAPSTTATAFTAAVPLILVSKDAIMLQGDLASRISLPPPDRQAAGVDGSYKHNGPNDLYIVPLGDALVRARRGSGGMLAVAFERAIPYRIVVEVLFTAGHSEYGTYQLLTRRADGVAAISITPPTIPSMRARRHPSAIHKVNPSVLLGENGIGVKTASGNIQPGCTGVGPGITLPLGPAGYDFDGLRSCAVRLKQNAPQLTEEDPVVIRANPGVTFGEVVSAIDALHDDAALGPLFPVVYFGVVR